MSLVYTTSIFRVEGEWCMYLITSATSPAVIPSNNPRMELSYEMPHYTNLSSSCHVSSLQSKYCPQYLFLNTLVLCSNVNINYHSFTPIQNHRQNHSFVYSNFYVFRQQTRSQKVLDRMVESITWIQYFLIIVNLNFCVFL
jgi:hypothetical protein